MATALICLETNKLADALGISVEELRDMPLREILERMQHGGKKRNKTKEKDTKKARRKNRD